MISLSLWKSRHSQSFSQFLGLANRIAHNFNTRIHDQLLALDSFSIAVTSVALNSGMTWPMVTIPDFAVRGCTARQQMKAETIGIFPVVTAESRQEWEAYSILNQNWINDAREWEVEKERTVSSNTRVLRPSQPQNSIPNSSTGQDRYLTTEADFSEGVSSSIYIVKEGSVVVDEGIGPFAPTWMTSPTPRAKTMINFNLLSHHLFWNGIETCIDSRLAVLTRVFNLDTTHKTISGVSSQYTTEHPVSAFLYPVFDTFQENHDLVAVLAAEISWTQFFENSLPQGAKGVMCVVETGCNQQFSYLVDGNRAIYLGPGDSHDRKYDRLVHTSGLEELIEMPADFAGVPLDFEHCPMLLNIYPTGTLQDENNSNGPLILASSVLAVFVVALSLLVYYGKGNIKSRGSNGNSSLGLDGILKSIGGRGLSKRFFQRFPKLKKKSQFKGSAAPPHLNATLSSFPKRITLIRNTQNQMSNSTVMYADIYGLNTWGAHKPPAEISNLVDTVYRSLNVLAKRHGVFQVEMAGDNFIAVVSADDCDCDHAAILVHFACQCRKRMSELFKSMSANELSMRFGVHSGHVELSGGLESSRFQLFGDTVETSFQMLATGKPNRIQVSVETAELLNLAGKSHWIAPRSDAISVKGKGEMSTFWVKPKACMSTAGPNDASGKSDDSVISESTFDESEWDNTSIGKTLGDSEIMFQGLIDQNVAILLRYLRNVFTKRLILRQMGQTTAWSDDPEIGVSIIEEAKEAIRMPAFDPRVAINPVDSSLVDIPTDVVSQLRLYVASIASTYRQSNAFHTFEHASHVVVTMDQMMKKIASSSDVLFTDFDGKPRSRGEVARDLDARTFSIASDPLTQFALVFAALVHDVDHVGVSNEQLIKEGSPIASLYKKRSVSEQNAVDISWWLLMTAEFEELRSAIYANNSEMKRFRQVLVNSVIATDIWERDMNVRRSYNWNKVFVKNSQHMDPQEKRDLQATVVVESLMQAADSGHGIQSFRTYLKWNERLFEEMLHAYHAGRSDHDPSMQWYGAELAYFDKFLIPLISRLKDCGVFGGSGETYLQRATENRDMWKSKGEALVHGMVETFSRRVVSAQDDTILFS